MSTEAHKFLPARTPETEAFWAGCLAGELRLQRCAGCGRHQFPPRALCADCGCRALEWVRASGRGRIASFTVVRRPLSPAYAAEVPYVVALIRLEEGPMMMSNVVGCPPERIAMAAPVGVVFERRSESIALPQFRLAGGPEEEQA